MTKQKQQGLFFLTFLVAGLFAVISYAVTFGKLVTFATAAERPDKNLAAAQYPACTLEKEATSNPNIHYFVTCGGFLE